MKNTKKIHQLTALRFIAAMMIVVHHSVGLFGIKPLGVNLGQGVSFFFVLSGFILTYVYSDINDIEQIKLFVKTRIARIWPAYFFSFCVGLLFIPYPYSITTAIAHIFMVQAWVPVSSFYFSYNAVAWSVSAELFFYLLFPFLIYKNKQYINITLGFYILFLLFYFYLINQLNFRDYGDPYNNSDGLLITQHGLIYIHPLVRIFEFIIGIFVAKIWLKYKHEHSSRTNLEMIGATFIEVFAFVLCGFAIYYSGVLAFFSEMTVFGSALSLWVIHSGSCWAFAFLIYIMANGRGYISRLLSSRVFVLLGEISFSMYLIHQIILIVYSRNLKLFYSIPDSIQMLFCFALLILISYLMWRLVEIPGRKFMLSIRAFRHK